VVDTPFLNDGADESLRKTVSLLNKIEAKTGATTITGPVTVSNEVEVTNSSGSPIPVSGTVTANTGLTQPLTNTELRLTAVPVSLASVPSHAVTGPLTDTQLRAAVVPVSLASAPVTPVTDNGGSLTVDGTVTANTGLAQPLTDTQLRGTAVSVVDSNLGATTDSAASTDTGTFSVLAFIKRGLQNWTSLLAKIPALVSGRIPVDGSGVTQPISAASLPLPSGASTAAKQPALGTAGTPSSDVITVQGASVGTALNTKETQPTDDYVINTSAFANFSPVGSALTSSVFDAGASADYVVITLEGGGSTGAFYYDLSILNTGLWDAGNAASGFGTYYDLPATSATDTYSYRNVASTSFFGGTRSTFNGRFIVPLTQFTPYVGTSTTYRYLRLNCPASYGGWRYRFTSYKSVNPLLPNSIPGNASTTRVTGRVDVGYVSGLPTLSATVTQTTATNLRAQAESYQGGTAVGSANPLQVTLANTAANATAVKVDGSAVTQPVSLASAPTTPVTGTFWQATQPISGIVTANTGLTQPLTDTQLRATAVSVSTIPSQGTTITNSDFTSITPSTSLVSAVAGRRVLSVFNEGAGLLYISGGATCTTTSYQVRLGVGEYWEAPAGQLALAHTAVFGTIGTARVSQVT